MGKWAVSTGVRAGYRWVCVPTFGTILGRLITEIPRTAVGKVVAITSFDSGPTTPSKDEKARGWHCVGDVLWTSCIEDPLDLPFADWVEWYIFGEERDLPGLQVLVNYGDFRLDDPQVILKANPTWDRYLFDTQLKLQQVFWRQLSEFRPLSFVAEGDHFNFATQDPALGEDVARWCESILPL